jgi:hypothetical protein
MPGSQVADEMPDDNSLTGRGDAVETIETAEEASV